MTSAGQREIKHTEFKRLAYRDRRRLAMKIRNAFKAHGVFINVFYSPLRSFVLEHMRTRLFLDEQRETRDSLQVGALRQAAEQGLDGVAWTTGDQQAERYSLEAASQRDCCLRARR